MMMVDSSSFTPETTKVLGIIHDAGTIRGCDLQRRAELPDPKALQDAVAPLVKKGLVTASERLDVSSIHYIQFAPLPSAREAVSFYLNNKA
jgi:hypothetical protein